MQYGSCVTFLSEQVALESDEKKSQILLVRNAYVSKIDRQVDIEKQNVSYGETYDANVSP